MPKKLPSKAEFGDFQTPHDLADAVLQRASALLGVPGTVLEPTCGVGNFLVAAHRKWGAATDLVGVEINGAYTERATQHLAEQDRTEGLRLIHQDFFCMDWAKLLDDLRPPVLIVGNPPWVTNAELGLLDSSNLPPKSNFQQQRGIDAITGGSNFDISEWMGTRLLEVLQGRQAAIALLLKVAVARKLLLHGWKMGLRLEDASIRRIDARAHFDAAVDACLFSCTTEAVGLQRCPVFDSLDADVPSGMVGMSDNKLLADIRSFTRTKHLVADSPEQWRSGVKHDCAKLMELSFADAHWRNGFGEAVDVEEHVLFPLLKSSHVAKGVIDSGRRVLVTQRTTGEDTRRLAQVAPKAWDYLLDHAEALDRRKSSIYERRPQFSIFGVGEYTFAPWKVAISGFYKSLRFMLVPPLDGKPVLFDDTVYFTPCWSEEEARLKFELLRSEVAAEFFSAYVFLDSKRPVTSRLLASLSFEKLACAAGRQHEYAKLAGQSASRSGQMDLEL